MKGNFFQNPTFPNNETTEVTDDFHNETKIDNNHNYENLLEKTIGKRVDIYVNNKNFNGILEKTGEDYLIVSDPTNSHYYLIFKKDITYIEYLENIKNIIS